MPESITLTCVRTEDLNETTQTSIIDVCITAHQEEDFKHLFSIEVAPNEVAARSAPASTTRTTLLVSGAKNAENRVNASTSSLGFKSCSASPWANPTGFPFGPANV